MRLVYIPMSTATTPLFAKKLFDQNLTHNFILSAMPFAQVTEDNEDMYNIYCHFCLHALCDATQLH